jgi:hypothetical protein
MLAAGPAAGQVATDGSGGRITIDAREMLRLGDGSRAATSVFGGADTRAGNIDIDPQFVVLNRGSAIRANATVGAGGAIRIAARRLVVSAGSVIDASAGPAGIDGVVVTSSPEVDLTSGLVVLPTVFLGVDRLLQAGCDARAGERLSSFTAVGRGGLPASPEQPLAAGYTATADARSPLATAPPGC